MTPRYYLRYITSHFANPSKPFASTKPIVPLTKTKLLPLNAPHQFCRTLKPYTFVEKCGVSVSGSRARSIKARFIHCATLISVVFFSVASSSGNVSE